MNIRQQLSKGHEKGKEDLSQPLGNPRRACVFDVGEILALINSYASSNLVLPRGPKYLYENIRDFVVVEVVGEKAEPKIVACGSLHVLWKDIAEIRALATHPRRQNRGLGSKIVRYLIEEARQMGIEKVFAFYLGYMGFRLSSVRIRPPRLYVWEDLYDHLNRL